MRKIKIQKIIYTFGLFSFCLFFLTVESINSATAEEAADNSMKCAKPGGVAVSGEEATPKKKVFCFFSLNNEKEFQYVKSANDIDCSKDTDRMKEETEEQCEERKRMLAAAESDPNVEIVEYYGADNKNQSVEERFKQMMEEKACDSLVLSGHHAEYFAGKQSIDAEEDWKLDLDFMEEMSCRPGCEDWFSNVKSLFLMGCNTVEGQLDSTVVNKGDQSENTRCENGNTADCKATYITINNAVDPNQDKDWNLGLLSQGTLNKAYSSTLDQNTNPLSSRYLKIFPNSSLYGWSETAPGVGALSRFSIPRFVHMVSGLTPDGKPRGRDLSQGSGVDEPDVGAHDIVNFLDVMNTQSNMSQCREFTATQWAKHWDSGTAPTSCYLDNDEVKEQYEGYKSNACGLNQALNEQPTSTEEVQRAVEEILKSGPEGIKRNFNHLMNLIVQSKWKTPPAWHDEVKQALQGSDELRDVLVYNLVEDKNIGFRQKADYLYFYKQVYGDSTNKDDVKMHQQVSNAFLDHLNYAYDQVFSLIDGTKKSRELTDESRFILVAEYHELIQTSVVDNGDNGLANWLYAHQEKSDEEINRFDNLIVKYKNPNLTRYLAPNEVMDSDAQSYSDFVKGFCEKLTESPPEVCKENESPPRVSSIISTLPILSLK